MSDVDMWVSNLIFISWDMGNGSRLITGLLNYMSFDKDISPLILRSLNLGKDTESVVFDVFLVQWKRCHQLSWRSGRTITWCHCTRHALRSWLQTTRWQPTWWDRLFCCFCLCIVVWFWLFMDGLWMADG